MASSAEPETRIKVFISYSRTDKAFASDLVLGLAACGFAPYIDREDIAAGEDWAARLTGLIGEADTIVYVISPDSVSSENCSWELAESLRLAKRVLPVVWRPVDDAATPAELKRLNYVFFSGEGRTFAAGLSDLAEALRTDISWIREHTRLAGLAQRWEARGRSEALLLRGDELDAAVAWTTAKPIGATPITDAQADFIKAGTDARAEAKRKADRARAGLLTAVSGVAVAMAVLAGAAAWQWRNAAASEVAALAAKGEAETATGEAVKANEGLRSANMRLGAEVWLRTAPSDNGYFVIDQGWYPVAANYSGAITRVVRSGGGRPTVMSTGFIIDGGLVHPDYAGEPLLVMPAGDIVDRQPDRPISLRPSLRTTRTSPVAPSDTLTADEEAQAKLLLTPGQPVTPADTTAPTAPGGPRLLVPGDTVAPDAVRQPNILPEDTLTAIAPPQPQVMSSRSAADTLAADDTRQVQGILHPDVVDGPETITVTFPALETDGESVTLGGRELVWRTPQSAGGEFPFQIWRLSGAPPFGWRAIAQDDVSCAEISAWSAKRTVAMLGIAVPAEGGPTPRALALNISELLNGAVVQNILYTHATNKASGGAPVFDLATGDVFAIHIGSEPDPDRTGRRRGYGYSLLHLLNVARGQVKGAKLNPLCETPR